MSSLTKEEENRLLTKEQINNLPDGTKIMVGWSNQINRPKMGEKITNSNGYSFVIQDDGTYSLGTSASVFLPFCQECKTYFKVDGTVCLNDSEFCPCPRCNCRCTCGKIPNKNADKEMVELLLQALMQISAGEHSDYGGDCLSFCPTCIAEDAIQKYEKRK